MFLLVLFAPKCYVPSLVEIGVMDLERTILKFLQCIFSCFVITSSWKWVGSFIWTNLNPLFTRLICAKFGQRLPSGLGEDVQISSMYFCYFVKRIFKFSSMYCSGIVLCKITSPSSAATSWLSPINREINKFM